MSKWEEKRLGKVAPFKYGKAMTADKRIFGDFNVFSSAGICGKSKMYLAKHGIVIGRKGSVGTVYYSESPFFCIDTAFYIDEIDPQYSMKFLYYYMKLLHLENYNNDAAVPGLNRNLAEKLKISCPDLPTQERIADILSAYDDLIEANNRRIELLEQAAQELYKEWFIRFRFPGHEKAKFENGLPEGWSVQRLSAYGRIETGKTPSMEKRENYGNDVMFIKTPDMHGNTFVIKSEEMLSECGHLTQPKKLLPPNSIMVTCIGSGGIVAINAEEAHTNQQINSIVLNDSTKLEWLYFTCKSLKSTIELFGATGTTMTNLSKGKFERLKVINPDDSLIVKYHQIVAPMLDNIKSLMYQNQNLATQRDLLLPRLMSGKLEV